MPALYPANPWTFGLPPSESGQLAKCGMGLSLRLRGEKPIEPCRGRCSFGTGHSSAESGLSSRATRRERMPRRRDAACGRRRSGPAFPGSASGLPGGVWSARWAVLMEEGYLAFLSTRRDFSRRKERSARAWPTSTQQSFRLRFGRLDRVDHDGTFCRIVLLLVDFDLGVLRDGPPKRLHARIVVFVTHWGTCIR